MSEEDLTDVDSCSVDSVEITQVLQREPLEDDNRLCYLCRTADNTEEVFDRSDLMDGAAQQRLVLAFEKRHPPAWDPVCSYCEGVGCEECICDECERPMRHINGVNYGCERHPVV